ncbi:MAG: hypothetical protein L0H53_04500 [Candidatus Nitrosocosmicus sp.]|nr:hypothetical protein [Candidatus Nitrosocosmicus sp.]MDN5866228.1 hypothetical protein [Candidatus Nitrosocosmicus sp.]
MIDVTDLILQVGNATSNTLQSGSSGVIQETVNQTQDTLYAGLAAAGTAISGIVAKVFHDNKKNKQSERETDFDQENYRRLVKVENDYTIKNPTKTRAEILAMSAYPDEPSIKTSLAESYATDYVEYQEYNRKKYYLKK